MPRYNEVRHAHQVEKYAALCPDPTWARTVPTMTLPQRVAILRDPSTPTWALPLALFWGDDVQETTQDDAGRAVSTESFLGFLALSNPSVSLDTLDELLALLSTSRSGVVPLYVRALACNAGAFFWGMVSPGWPVSLKQGPALLRGAALNPKGAPLLAAALEAPGALLVPHAKAIHALPNTLHPAQVRALQDRLKELTCAA